MAGSINCEVTIFFQVGSSSSAQNMGACFLGDFYLLDGNIINMGRFGFKFACRHKKFSKEKKCEFVFFIYV